MTGPDTKEVSPGMKKHRVAVLPLENISPDPNDAYFADGLTEELITSLSKFAAFRVIARTSIMRYKGQSKPVAEISRELGVSTLVEGSVRKSANKLRVAVQLVDARSEERIWSREYEREIDDAFAIQIDIAKKIAAALKIKIPEHEKTAIESLATSVPEAYNLYLSGRYYWNQRTETGLMKAIDFFKQSLQRDPQFALAHTGLADAYGQLALFELIPPSEAFPKARAEAEAALAINNGLAEAHTSLGLVMFQYEREWSGAEREFKRAIELNANYAPAHQFYADFLKATGRFEEALAQMKQALDIDPLSLAINTGFGHVLYLSRQYDRAIEQYQKVIKMDPNYLHARLWFGRPYLQKGMYKEAVNELEQAVSLSGRSTISLAVLGHALASSGNRPAAMTILEELFQRSKERYLPSYWIALVYVGLGDKEKAFEWLGKAFEERSSWLVWMKVEPRFDSLRSDPRFSDLLDRMGLLESQLPRADLEISRERSAERRSLVAIVFTDIVGFTRLSQIDESLALSLLKNQENLLRQILAKHGGKEIKTIGDSFLIEFASALDAVECSIEIQDSMRRTNDAEADPKRKVELRIGIHVGDVVHRDNDIFGDAVNIASRIQSLAGPGGICISQQVYDQIWNKIGEKKIQALGKQSLRNVETPVAVFSIAI